jgi:hypothetical protein
VLRRVQWHTGLGLQRGGRLPVTEGVERLRDDPHKLFLVDEAARAEAAWGRPRLGRGMGDRALGLVHGHAGFASLRDFTSPKQYQNQEKNLSFGESDLWIWGETVGSKQPGKKQNFCGLEKTS